ncbi:MAG: hypothetical protein AAF483_09210 [Planctomycetota bacterium]
MSIRLLGFREFRIFLQLFLCALPLVGSQPLFGAQTSDEPETGGLGVEQGLRLRIYWIGSGISPGLPLQTGQSPNVDMTVPGVTVESGTSFQDDQAITDKKSEKISNEYIAEWTGWFKSERTGRCSFKFNTSADVKLSLGGTNIGTRQIKLKQGWYTFRLVQTVSYNNHQPIELMWAFEDETPKTIDSSQLRAPAFYFRPTQGGKKQLSRRGARPGLGQKLTSLHPGYRVTNIRPGGMEMPVGGLGMLSDGRLVVARFDATTLKAPLPSEQPNGELWLISNPTSDVPAEITGEKIAKDLFEPSGLKVIDDAIYVSQRSELSKFTYNPETKAWDKSVVASGWETYDFHQISAGLPWIPGPTDEHPGFLYMSRGAGLGQGRNPPDHASVWRIDLSKEAGQNVEVITGGHRTPNGLGLDKTGECFVIDNQGGWTPANKINHVQQGRFYGFYLKDQTPYTYPAPFQPKVQDGVTDVTPAAILMPQDDIANSPTQLLMFPEGHQFDGQMALADMRYGGLNRVMLEKTEGVYQGCVMRFTQGLEAGPNRVHFGPDGSLYVGGIGGNHASTWYWVDPQGKPTFQGLERLTPTDEKVFEIKSMRITSNGFTLNFTQPVPKATLEATANYSLKQWMYRASSDYGGPKINLQILQVSNAEASKDRKTVTLTVPGVKEGYLVHLTTDPVSVDGEAIWSGDVWYTVNRIPR